MRTVIWNLFSVLAIGAVAALYATGMMTPQNAFFLAFSAVAVFTGYQIASREHLPLPSALASMLVRPGSYKAPAAYVAYIGCMAVGLLVVVQTLVA